MTNSKVIRDDGGILKWIEIGKLSAILNELYVKKIITDKSVIMANGVRNLQVFREAYGEYLGYIDIANDSFEPNE